MGIFWRITSNVYRSSHVLDLQEPKGTISGEWPFLWRLGQYKYLLEVKDLNYRHGFYLYSYSEKDKTLRFHNKIHTQFVVVSVGPEKIQYWAEGRGRESLPLVFTGIKMAGPLVRKADAVKKSFLKHHVIEDNVTWA